MSEEYYAHTISNLMILYEEVCDWFTDIGFDYTRHRYGLYNKRFDSFLDLRNNRKVDEELLSIKRAFDNAYLEVNEIIRIYNSLKGYSAIEFTEQIKEICSGQEFRGKSNNDKARDFLFELSVASRFIKAGYSVSMNQICDIVVSLDDNVDLFVECKRIKSIKQIKKNIKKANSQINTRIEANSANKSFGLIALNITDIIYSTNHLSAVNEIGFTQIHRNIAKKFIEDKESDLRYKINMNCFGLMLESTKMGYSSKEASEFKLFFSRHTNYLKFHDNEIFENMVPKLNNQDIV